MTDASALVAQLAAAGTPPELLAAVAKELFAGETARSTIDARRKKDRERKPHKSEEIHGNPRTSEEIEEFHDGVSLDKETSPRPLKEINPIPCERESRAWALPAGVSLQVWTDFLTNRKRKRLPNTETAWKTFNDDLARISAQTGIPPPKLIERCTAKGWASINDPREQGNGRISQQPGLRGTRPDPALDLYHAAVAAERRENGQADRRAGPSLPAIGAN